MKLYTLFIVFHLGHNIKIGQYQFVEHAIEMADYHHKEAKTNDCHFEVCHAGDIVYSTDT